MREWSQSSLVIIIPATLIPIRSLLSTSEIIPIYPHFVPPIYNTSETPGAAAEPEMAFPGRVRRESTQSLEGLEGPNGDGDIVILK